MSKTAFKTALRTAMVPLIALAMAAAGCKTTESKTRVAKSGSDNVTIKGSELEPIRTFLMDTRRVLVADYVRVRCTPQFFKQQMGMVRDQEFVTREVKIRKDGQRTITLTSRFIGQKTNFDKNRLPRVYFGQSGLELIATRSIRIYFVASKDTDRPLFIDVLGKSDGTDAQLWTSGRLQIQKPSIHMRSELIWSEDFATYKHKSSVG